MPVGPPPLPAAEVALRALRQALSQPQYAKGLVVDGLASALVNAATAGRCLLQAVGLTLKQPPPVPPLPLPKGKGSAAATRKTSTSVGPPPEPEVPKPDEWLGAQRLYSVQLTLPKETAAARLAAAAQAAAAGLELADVELAEGDEGLLAEASVAFLQQEQQAGGNGGAKAPQLQQAAGAVSDAKLQQDAAFEQRWRAFEADTASLMPVLGSMQPPLGPIMHRLVSAEPAEGDVAHGIVGVQFDLGKVSTVLPAVPDDALLIPPPFELRVLQRPKDRRRKSAASNFKLWTGGAAGSGGEAAAGQTPAAAGAVDAGGAAAADARSPSPQPGTAPGSSAAAGGPTAAAVPAASKDAPAKRTGTGTPRKGKKSEAVLESPEPVIPDEQR